MQEEIENKTLSLIINTSKFTERTLATAFAKALKLGWNKAKEHYQAKPQGRQSVKQLIGQNQGVEQTALADRQEVKAFERYARQYGVDYAIHKGTSDSGKTRYLVFFKARDRAAIDQAMRAYAMDFLAKRKAQRNVQPQLDTASPQQTEGAQQAEREGKMNTAAWEKRLLLHLPYGVIGLAAAKLSEAWRLSAGTDFSAKFLHLRDGVAMAFRNGLSGFVPLDLLIGFLCGCALCLLVHAKRRNAKKYRHGEEYGAARWGKPSDIAPFMDADPWNNIILTQTERLTMSSRPANPQNARNKNVLVIGGSGSGKTRFFIKPNIMQCTKTKGCSLVITDPKGTLITECGKMLAAAGYDVRVFNVISFKKSMHYNPFAYIRSEKDILKLVTALIANTKGEGKGGDDFWIKAETLLYMALIGYIHYELPPAAQNFTTLIDMMNSMEVREEDEEYRNPVDLMFEKLKAEKPEHFAVRQYAKYRMAAGKTAKSILVSCGARLAVFDIQELREITAYDELHLDTLGDKRTALFLIMSDTDASFNFLISLAYSQMFNLLCEKADDVYGGRLPVHVRCLLDEFANIGQIPNFERLIATIRSREISACIVLQAQSQLKAIYKDSADTIVGNCDTLLFLGGKEKTTLKEMEELLGKETIDTFNTGESRGREVSHSLNYQKLGKSLMTMDELAVMDGGKCILQLRGVRPFLSEKYDITKHPNYKYLSDFHPKNAFHIEKYLSHQLKLRLEEEFAAVEVEVSGTSEEEEALLDEWAEELQQQAAESGGLF